MNKQLSSKLEILKYSYTKLDGRHYIEREYNADVRSFRSVEELNSYLSTELKLVQSEVITHDYSDCHTVSSVYTDI